MLARTWHFRQFEYKLSIEKIFIHVLFSGHFVPHDGSFFFGPVHRYESVRNLKFLVKFLYSNLRNPSDTHG